MAGFEDLMNGADGGAGSGGEELTISITKKADGSFMVEKETSAEDQSEQGQGGEMGETTGTPAKSLDEAMQIARSMFDEASGNTEDAAFSAGFESTMPAKKGMM